MDADTPPPPPPPAQSTKPTDLPLPVGAVLSPYRIEESMARGGSSFVYLAFDEQLQRRVVLKEHFPAGLCQRDSISGNVFPRPEERGNYARSLREFRDAACLLSGLLIDGIPTIHDIFEAAGTIYVVREYIEGRSLQQVVMDPGCNFTPKVRLSILRKMLHLLEELHAAGVLHRDIKPDNILVDTSGRPYLIDFGAAARLDALDGAPHVVSPPYSAPELNELGDAGTWTDIYALGMCFAGCPSLLARVLPCGATSKLRTVVRAMTLPHREQRLQTASECLRCLDKPSHVPLASFVTIGLCLGLYFTADRWTPVVAPWLSHDAKTDLLMPHGWVKAGVKVTPAGISYVTSVQLPKDHCLMMLKTLGEPLVPNVAIRVETQGGEFLAQSAPCATVDGFSRFLFPIPEQGEGRPLTFRFVDIQSGQTVAPFPPNAGRDFEWTYVLPRRHFADTMRTQTLRRRIAMPYERTDQAFDGSTEELLQFADGGYPFAITRLIARFAETQPFISRAWQALLR